jgi:predicted transcriptional regulator
MDAAMSRLTSVRLSDELAGRLDQLAASLDRPKAWLIEQAIARFVEEETWQMAAITEALTAYQKGGATLRSHDEVMERLGAKIRTTTDDANPVA